MKSISSRHNPWFKRIREAIREHDSEIVIEGPKPVNDAIGAGWKPLALITRGEERGDAIAFSAELFDALTETSTPQGVLGLFERPHASLESILARRDTIAVALDRVQDPGNVGTIIRLAAAFDAAGVILLPGCADPYGPKAIRSSAGAILNMPVATSTVESLLAAGRPLVAADMDGDPAALPARDAVLVLGSEGSGVSSEIARASKKVAIRMSGRVESLNVATAAAILLSQSFALR